MGQLGILLWKNFMWCRVNYVKTALFFVIPGVLFLLAILIKNASDTDNIPDCHYETIALPPSNPVVLLPSLFCHSARRCINESQWPHTEPEQYFDRLQHSFDHNQQVDWDENRTLSCGCPGIPSVNVTKLAGMNLAGACVGISQIDDRVQTPLAEFVFRGIVLFYPETNATAWIVQAMIAHLDKIQLLKPLAVLNVLDKPASAAECALKELSMLAQCYQPLGGRLLGFDSRADAVQWANDTESLNHTVWGMIQFIETSNTTIEYNLISEPRARRNRIQAMYLQSLIETALNEFLSGAEPGSTKMNLATKLLPMRCRKNLSAYNGVYTVIQAVNTIGLIISLYCITGEMCFEKSAGLIEFLQIAGVSRHKIRLSWLLFTYTFLPAICLVYACMFLVVFPEMFLVTPLSMYLLASLLLSLSLTSMCMTVSSGSSSAQKAAVTVLLIQIIGFLVPTWGALVPRVGYEAGTLTFARICAALHPAIAYQMAVAYMLEFEILYKELGWENMFESPVVNDGFGSVGECMMWMVGHIVVYYCLSVYLDHVAPSKYGFKKPVYFFLQPSYWCSSKASISAFEKVNVGNGDIKEPDPNTGIHIENLTKTYGSYNAVDSLTVTFPKGEITAFLGHNGAGKSTTMNMLTGMLSPTSGDAYIDGRSVLHSMTSIRQSLGYCPQYDIIYPNLTVLQHLTFFGTIKSIPTDVIQEYSSKVLAEMSMSNKKQQNRIARNLSGGMKRKLSIAISFLGLPNTIILDEPTSAIDPFSRRAIWDLILSFKAKATILISTHYMQEADVLGDRIAIINKGALKAVGTPLELKTKFGQGSTLILAHNEAINETVVTSHLKNVSAIKLFEKTPTETSYIIPIQVAHSAAIIDLLLEIEKHCKEWKISTFGIQEPTLEQVFFKVAAEGAENYDANDEKRASSSHSNPAKIGYTKSSGPMLWLMHLYATILKRIYLNMRSKKSLFFQIVMPLFFCGTLILFNGIISEAFDSSMTRRSLADNNMTNLIFGYRGNVDKFWQQTLETGLGTICSEGECESANWPNDPANPGIIRNCSCQLCDEDAIGNKPFETELPSGEIAIDLRLRDVSDYLVKTNAKYIIGALSTEFITYPEAGPIMLRMLQAFAVAQSMLSENRSSGFMDRISGLSGMVPGGSQVVQEPVGNPALSERNTNPLSAMLDLFSGEPEIGTERTERVYKLWTGMASVGGGRPTFYALNMRFMRASLLNAFNNAFLRSKLINETTSPVNNYAVYMNDEELSLDASWSIGEFVSAIFLGLFSSFALVMPTFIIQYFVVTENASSNKQLQILSGLNVWFYWVANLAYDLFLFLVSIMLMVAVFAIFPDVFKVDLYAYVLLAMLYGLSMILLSYDLSFIMSNARTSILVIGLATYILSIAALILNSLFNEFDWAEAVANATDYLPPCFITLSVTLSVFHELLPERFKEEQDLFSDEWVGTRIQRSLTTSVTLLVVLIVCESGIFKVLGNWLNRQLFRFKNFGTVQATDEDVVKEANEILSGNAMKENVVTVENLHKYYALGDKYAVKGVSFGVRRSECFGLLGVNGAGKSTLFQMLCGFHPPSAGCAHLLGIDVFGYFRGAISSHMSYCPQHDVLFDEMSVYEHLKHYARLRGIKSSDHKEVLTDLIEDVGLGAHVKKAAGALSGGNRRKLNFAISILDYPDVIFLDEMTTGMDPKARRSAWNCLKKARQMGCATVITSHSMEECEQLCDRLVIMVDGGFECLGGVQHLKDKFGKRYNIKMRIAPDESLQKVTERVKALWPHAELTESHVGYLEVSTPAAHLLLSSLFTNLLTLVDEFNVKEFSVSQTSLEHLFVSLIKKNQWDGGN